MFYAYLLKTDCIEWMEHNLWMSCMVTELAHWVKALRQSKLSEAVLNVLKCTSRPKHSVEVG